LLTEAREEALVETPDEQIELLAEALRGVRVRVVGVRERDAPDLLALRAPEILEVLREPRDEIALREQHVDREANPELLVELEHALPDRRGMRAALGFGLREQIRDRDRDEDAVDRPAAAVLLQKPEEAEPCGLINVRVAVLR